MLTILQAFLNLILPPTCLACHRLLITEEKHLCTICSLTLPSAQLEVPSKKRLLMQKFYGLIPFTHAFSLYHFSKKGCVQQLLHSLKYRYQKEALLYLGRHLGDTILEKSYKTAIDIIIPVPLHHTRYKKRGYNQSYLLAQGISQSLQKPVLSEALIRVTHTPTQTRKQREQRWQNVANAFTLQKVLQSHIKDKNILLVDDLVTTGATLTACAQPLLKVPVRSLSLATLSTATQA